MKEANEDIKVCDLCIKTEDRSEWRWVIENTINGILFYDEIHNESKNVFRIF